MPITTGSYPKLLWPGIQAIWGQVYTAHKQEYPDLFELGTSDKSYEEDTQVTSFGLARQKAEGAGVAYDTETQGVISRYVNVTYALGFIVTEEQIEDNKYMEVAARRTKSLAFSFNQTKENVAANIYNRAFNTSYTGGDGAVLVTASHTTVGGNQSNILAPAADISETAVEDLVIQIMNATNDKGLKISLMPKSLIVPPQLFFEASRILNSTLTPGTGNNAINVLNAESVIPEGIKVNHYLTDADAWFIRTNCPDSLKFLTRVAMQITEDNDFDTTNYKVKGRERYSCGWSDWRGVYGSPGA